MPNKAEISEARKEAAAALLISSTSESRVGFIDSAQQTAGVNCAPPGETALTGTLGPHLPNATGRVRLSAFSSGTAVVGVTGVQLNIEIAPVIAGPYTTVASCEASGIPTGAGLGATETISAALEVVLTPVQAPPGLPLFARLTCTPAGAAGGYTAGTAIQGGLTWTQLE